MKTNTADHRNAKAVHLGSGMKMRLRQTALLLACLQRFIDRDLGHDGGDVIRHDGLHQRWR